MVKILFVCHGNICRSPMAEFIMKDLVKKAGLETQFVIESAATSTEEIGNPVYPPARRKLAEHGISCAGKTSRQLVRADCGRYDLLIGMDRANLRNMRRICGGDHSGKIRLLMEFTDRPGEVADPWYTGDFETTWQDVLEGCQGLLKDLTATRPCLKNDNTPSRRGFFRHTALLFIAIHKVFPPSDMPCCTWRLQRCTDTRGAAKPPTAIASYGIQRA